MRVVLALDKFKGTFSAQLACELVAEGIKHRNPKIESIIRPMADGGEGTAAAISASMGMEVLRVIVPDIAGKPTEALIHWHNSRRIALIESAEVLGLARTLPSEESLLKSSSLSLGRLLQKAFELRPLEIWIAIGGTMCADAGWGIASLFGMTAYDSAGSVVLPSLENMEKVSRIEISGTPDYLKRTKIVALCDVNAPAVATGVGISLASFLEQKGAHRDSIGLLTKRIQNFWSVLQQATPHVAKLQDGYTGAGGGICIGLSALSSDLRMELGAQRVAKANALNSAMSGAQLVVCGEGCLDEQTFYGKAPTIVSQLAADHNAPLIGIFGKVNGDENTMIEKLGLCELHKLSQQLPPPQFAGDLIKTGRSRFYEIGIHIAQRIELSHSKTR